MVLNAPYTYGVGKTLFEFFTRPRPPSEGQEDPPLPRPPSEGHVSSSAKSDDLYILNAWCSVGEQALPNNIFETALASMKRRSSLSELSSALPHSYRPDGKGGFVKASSSSSSTVSALSGFSELGPAPGHEYEKVDHLTLFDHTNVLGNGEKGQRPDHVVLEDHELAGVVDHAMDKIRDDAKVKPNLVHADDAPEKTLDELWSLE